MGAVPVRLTASRAAALRVLKEVRTRDAWGHEILGRVLETLDVPDGDVAFMTRIAYGALASEGTLDEVLDRYIDRPSRVHPLVRDALRIATYELLYMRTPDRVAVHQGVEAVRSVEPRAVGMANAVLRRIAEAAPSFPWGDPETDIEALARVTAHPLWLVRTLVHDLGLESARSMLAADNEPAPLFLAHNPFAGSEADLMDVLNREGVEPRACAPAGCIVAGHPSRAVRSAALDEGACIVVDAAAQFVASIAAPQPAGRGVDLAAGRGTKTLLMQAAAVRAGGPAEITAADVHPFKIALLEERMGRLRVPGVKGVVADATRPDAIAALGGPSSADVVLLDAPCSGLGALRRHPEKRWRLDPASIEALATLSQTMLETASLLVRPGGFVVYSTCTVTDRENRQVVEGFLAGSAGGSFSTVSLADSIPADWERFVTSEGWFRSVPEAGGPDGHFAAVLACEEDRSPVSV